MNCALKFAISDISNIPIYFFSMAYSCYQNAVFYLDVDNPVVSDSQGLVLAVSQRFSCLRVCGKSPFYFGDNAGSLGIIYSFDVPANGIFVVYFICHGGICS